MRANRKTVVGEEYSRRSDLADNKIRRRIRREFDLETVHGNMPHPTPPIPRRVINTPFDKAAQLNERAGNNNNNNSKHGRQGRTKIFRPNPERIAFNFCRPEIPNYFNEEMYVERSREPKYA